MRNRSIGASPEERRPFVEVGTPPDMPPDPTRSTESRVLSPEASIASPKTVERKLEYKWSGTDDEGHPIETILVDVGEKQIAIAYSPQLHKQYEQVEVIPIASQTKNAKTSRQP